jgi:DHA1 family multidrug resistance protein-like MFS transporter
MLFGLLTRQYSYFESFPFVYQGVYGFSTGEASIVFISILIAGIIGAIIFAALQWFIYEPYTMENGIGVPEARLVPGIYASAAAPIGVFIFAWTARENVHWIVPTLGVVIYSTAQLIVSPRDALRLVSHTM